MIRGAVALLSLALATGLVLAGIRFFSDRPSPVWLARLHGLAALVAVALLARVWMTSGRPADAVAFALAALVIAAGGGLALDLGWRRRRRPLPEGLVFAHLSVAFVGSLVALMVRLSLPG